MVTPILLVENLRPKGKWLVPIGISGRTRRYLIIQSVIVLLNLYHDFGMVLFYMCNYSIILSELSYILKSV